MADDKKKGMMASAFGEPDKPSSIIKVIGVGGGGGNAVNHMYREGIHDVTFVLCNTDKKALNDSPVPVHLQLGKEGLGAGNKPEKGRQEAEDSEEEIKHMLNDGTKMVFITAGMGGGTGTGAGPVVARIAKEMGILTVGIVTIPFEWEGKKKILQALTGVEKMAQNVDALLVINNQRLFDIYPELSLIDAFGKADDTLSVTAKSIAEIITMHGIINLDFNDVKTVLKDGGVALMSTGFGKGEDRLKKAIENALHSPLLNDNDVFNSKKILLSVSFSSEGEDKKNELMMDEMKAINEFMDGFDDDIETKWGVSIDPELKENVKVTILATGFGMKVEDGKMNITDKNEQSVEEMRKTRQKKDAEDALIDSYYGKGGNNKERPQVRCFIFGNDDLDNDNLISAIESMPTYSRSRTQNNELIKLSKGDVDSVSQTKVGTTTSGTIKFA